MGEAHILAIFQGRPMLSHIIRKVSARAFIDVAEHRSIVKNMGEVHILAIFQDRPMFSHIIRKVSARAFH